MNTPFDHAIFQRSVPSRPFPPEASFLTSQVIGPSQLQPKPLLEEAIVDKKLNHQTSTVSQVSSRHRPSIYKQQTLNLDNNQDFQKMKKYSQAFQNYLSSTQQGKSPLLRKATEITRKKRKGAVHEVLEEQNN